MHLYLGEEPRTLYLVTGSHDVGRPRRALVFQAAERNPSQAVVEFLPKEEVDLTKTVRLTNRVIKGCLGLVSISNELFLALVTSATEVGNTRPSASLPESVAKIHEIAFYSLTTSTWDDLSSDVLPSPGQPDFADIPMTRDPYGSNTPPPGIEHPCSPLVKILSSGSFYYALEPHFDLSSRLSHRLSALEIDSKESMAFDERFVWNEYIIRSLLDFRERLDAKEREDFDLCQFLVLAIQGYVGVFTVPLPAPPTNGSPIIATLTLISRLGKKRAGTRFNTRGVDDDGNTANFVETETLFSTDQHCFSYVQVRGSVPLFWEQQGMQAFGQRIQITRPHASQPAFDRHFAQLTEEYGPAHAINLLGTKENEASLTTEYARHMRAAQTIFGEDVGITHFDFHNAVRVGGHESIIRDLRRLDGVRENIDRFGFSMCDSTSGEIITEQKGIFRTNCLDCTLFWYGENGFSPPRFGHTIASYGPKRGKRTLAGVLSDATKSVSRAYINNFQDKGKQAAIDMFLGNLSNQRQVTIFDPIHDSIRAALDQRMSEYSTIKPCTIFAGTWNLNGRPPSSESLLPWLFPSSNASDPDIFAIGFQEIVPLTAQQIVQTDPEKRRIWEARLLDTLDKRPNKQSQYVLLRSEQLVGTALVVLVKSNLTAVLRKVEAATRKTGLRGMSGNKGAVAIRLDYHDTSFCFVTAHLAAGHGNVDERNADYHTIVNGLHFSKGKTIESHENVVWLADTNYRIDLENGIVRSCAVTDQLDVLLGADQLRAAIDSRAVFAGYEEGPILFRPTYKYDVGTDQYDTSEKLRVPAWTDRILFKGKHLDLMIYSRAELRGSDHKPVYALFRSDVRIIDAAKRAALAQLLADNVLSTAPGEKLDEKLASLTFYSDSGELPEPSSDVAAWWDMPDHPGGVFAIHDSNGPPRSTNPFDSLAGSPISSSPSSSEEEIYAALQTPMAMAPALIPDGGSAYSRKPPPVPSRSTKPPAMPRDTSAS